MIKIGIILGSTRPNRSGEQVATWVHDLASRRGDAEFELIDLRDHPLPHLDEPLPPSMGQYHNQHTRRWAATIAPLDGFIMVTPEYNHSTSAVLKNALDYLYAEWNNKAELQMADVRQQVTLSLLTDFENYAVFRPGDHHAAWLDTLIDQVIAWSTALAPLRIASPAAARG
jgi:NAD(P)H-dependent FMN reductase